VTGRRATVVLLVAAIAAVVALSVAALRGPTSQPTLQQRVDEVASSLRCPVCQNLSVADSPSGLAAEMRRAIADRLREGDSPEEIRAGFVDAYGEWILQAPPKEGINLVAWLAPTAVLLAGAGAAALAVRRWRRDVPPRDSALSAEDRHRLERAMAREEAQ
jgi:cytochrome c-type biogenesis protein CcmH